MSPARLIDGAEHAANLRSQTLQRARSFFQTRGRRPPLVVIIVGDHPASRSYVSTTTKQAAETKIDGRLIELPEAVDVADRLEAVNWRNWKLAFYDETRDWFSTPMKLTLPKLFNLTTDPKEEYPEETLRNTWAMDGCLKAIREFYGSLKKYPAIPEGTPDPYMPPN
jgi:hypothetical protein